MKITIIGAGAFGTALGGILADKGYDIDYYDPKKETKSLQSALEGAKSIILAMPSAQTPYILPHLPKNLPIIVATKGILNKKPFQDFNDIIVISGPGFAEDIKNQKPTKLTATDQRAIEMLSTDYLSFDQTSDLSGVLMCGALKNAYAILAGIKNLKKDTPKWREFIDSSVNEMKEILAINYADPKTVDLACGIGDLELTCDIPSRNYQYGQSLKENPEIAPNETVEGIAVLKRIKRGEIMLPDSVYLIKELLEKVPCL